MFPLLFMYCSNLSCKFSRQTQKKLVGFSHYGHFRQLFFRLETNFFYFTTLLQLQMAHLKITFSIFLIFFEEKKLPREVSIFMPIMTGNKQPLYKFNTVASLSSMSMAQGSATNSSLISISLASTRISSKIL
jgi:hypothetical protein